jgi:prepilin peptidase dependent protein B
MRKGFTLIELLVGASIGIIVIGFSIILLSFGYRLILDTISFSRGNTSVFQVVEIINSDLRKTGYGIEDTSTYPPVEWENDTKTLTIRYVDYEKDLNGDDIPDCENETFGDNNTPQCDYIITYQFKDNNLYRSVDEEANGSSSSASMFDERIITVEHFTVDITDHKVQYKIEGRIKSKFKNRDKEFSIGDTIICRNWK